MMKKKSNPKYPTSGSIYGKINKDFMREYSMRFSRGNVRLMQGSYLDKQDIEKMRKEIIKHDFTRI